MKKLSNKAIAEKFANKVWNEKEISAIDEFMDENVIIHSLLGNFQGPEQMKTVAGVWLHAFPDLLVQNTHTICENDSVVILWTGSGTHRGEFKNHKPTDKKISYAGATIYRIENGKILEYWAYLDMQHILNQIA